MRQTPGLKNKTPSCHGINPQAKTKDTKRTKQLAYKRHPLTNPRKQSKNTHQITTILQTKKTSHQTRTQS